MIRVLIADDHELIRVGVRKILRSSRDIQVVGEATNTEETVRLVEATRPDALVLDIHMPGHEGLEGLAHVRRKFPSLPVVILSMYPEERFAIPALRAGASGYITKSMAAEELVTALRKVAVGGNYVSPRLAELLALDVRSPPAAAPHQALTRRELCVLSLMGSGRPVKQIAAELGISISSVNTYRSRIYRKMNLRSNAALIRYAVENGLDS